MDRIPIRGVALALIVLALTVQASLAQPTGVVSSNRNPRQIALKHWYVANCTATFAAGSDPTGMAFDGANIWVTNLPDGTASKLIASDGTLLGIGFDGSNVWVANTGSNNVMMLRASDGKVFGTFPVGAGPSCLSFDGANIWVPNFNDATVTKLRANEGLVLGTFSVGIAPAGVAFDGASVRVAVAGADGIAKM